MTADMEIAGERKVVIAGIGDAGCNVILKTCNDWGAPQACVAFNTDRRCFMNCPGARHFEIGGNVTKGMGAGGNVGLGRRAAVTNIDTVKNVFAGANMALVVAGLGGGTGTGATPVILESAQGQGVLTVAFCILPFNFEGSHRMSRALEGLKRIQSLADTVFIVNNQLLFDSLGADINITEAFSRSDAMIAPVLFAMWRTLAYRGVINHDFTDIRAVLESDRECVFGSGVGSGEGRAEKALENLKLCPLLKSGASDGKFQSLIINIVSGPNLSLGEMSRVFEGVKSMAGTDAIVSAGAACVDELKDKLLVTLMASPHGDEEEDAGTGASPLSSDSSDKSPSPARGQTAAEGEKKRKTKKTGRFIKQSNLFEDTGVQGRFKDTEPTFYRGNNLDVPTFKRLNIVVQRIKDKEDEVGE